MRAYDIIIKKRNNEKLTKEEISFMIEGFTRGDLPDYQMAAFLMAVWFNKMDGEERAQLTLDMLNSGSKFDLTDIDGIKADKHSTGGVGDGPSLSLAPIVAAAGGKVPMMSGRGLGHTGGTLDKLESIPGYTVEISEEEAKKILKEVGVMIVGQTADVAPADKKIYALRDVTATVDSIDLISGSIMSKKLAEGMDALVLDVKTGKGAFMSKKEDAIALALSMVEIGVNVGKDMFSFISDMTQPLGKAIGNALEIKQTIEILKGRGPADITELVYQISSRMLVMSKLAASLEEARKIVEEMVSSGKALEKFRLMVEAQKGDGKVVDDPDGILPGANLIKDIIAKESGYISDMDALKIGLATIALGGGRETMDSKIDYGVGFMLEKKLGDKVEKNDVIAKVYANDENKLNNGIKMFEQAIQYSENPIEVPPLIYGYVTIDGFTESIVKRP